MLPPAPIPIRTSGDTRTVTYGHSGTLTAVPPKAINTGVSPVPAIESRTVLVEPW